MQGEPPRMNANKHELRAVIYSSLIYLFRIRTLSRSFAASSEKTRITDAVISWQVVSCLLPRLARPGQWPGGRKWGKMSEAWNQWEGCVVDDGFRLKKYLGGSEESAVFLTEDRGPEPKKAAIKLVAAEPATAERR